MGCSLCSRASHEIHPPIACQLQDASPSETADNKALVQASFDRWHAGTGSPFELLVPEVDWTIVGSSPLSKTYSRQAFLDEVIHPFNARMATPLVPTVRGLYGDGDMVIILFDAAATTRDRLPYRNTYTWYFPHEGQDGGQRHYLLRHARVRRILESRVPCVMRPDGVGTTNRAT